jgi:hypothetical protein
MMKKQWKNMLRFLGKNFSKYPVSLIMKTIRIRKINFEEIEQLDSKGKNYVIAFWHGWMALPWYVFRNKKITAVVSQSKDGEVLTEILKYWNYDILRGSSAKGGKEVFYQSLDKVKSGFILALTPDGPKGPARVAKSGFVVISQRTEVPLFLIIVRYYKYIEFKSWDKFKFPYPFSKAVIKAVGPFNFSREASREQIEDEIKKIENILNLETDKL